MAAHGDREVRLERLHPAEVRAAMAEAPIAWLPLGALEFHAEHLPFGTDGFSAQQVAERAARLVGGVVLPWSYLTLGTLHLPWTFRYDAGLVEAALRETLLQLADHGARVVVVHTGHGPLDLNHLIKRVCAEVEAEAPAAAFRAYGLCYLELNAALGAGLGTAWPVAVDHGSILETSWVLAVEPDLVHPDRLPADPAATDILGVYGPNPRDRASRELGERQLEACAALLAERAGRLLAGERLDAFADLRDFVAHYWPEPLELSAGGGPSGSGSTDGATALLLRNPAPVSRYLTGLRVRLDGRELEPEHVSLVNGTVGEAGIAMRASTLGPEAGFYVRRGQTAEVRLPVALTPGRHAVTVELGLAGVATTSLEREVDVP
jgi:creatinine amidohydrolase